MSDIATKLTTMADNTPSVAEEVNAAKFIASGAVVRVDDVLDVEHPLQVQLSSDSVTDFSGIEVKAFGKNLFDDVAFYEANGFVLQEDGTWFGKNLSKTIFENTAGISGAFTISSYAKRTDGINSVVWTVKYTDGTQKWRTATTADGEFSAVTWTTDASKTVASIGWTYQDVGNYYVKDVQIEYGAAATDYESYKEPQSATADASGKVSGLVSVAPTMTLLTDTEGVTVECAYFPESAADIYAKYQELKQEQIALQDKLQEYLQEE